MVPQELVPLESTGRVASDLGRRGCLLSVALCLIVLVGGLTGCREAPSDDPSEKAVSRDTSAVYPSGGDSASAAFASFRIRNWTIEDGLLGRANAVAQTPDGYLWVTTNEGLFRFDGARFVGFTTATVPVFRSDDFISVDVLPSGDLWVGSKDLWTYRLRGGEWTAYGVDEVFEDRDWVQGFVQAGDGTVWVSSTGRSIARFDGTGWATVGQRIRDVWTPFVADAAGTLWTYLDAADAPGFPASPLHRHGGVVARWDGKRFTPPQDWRLFGFEQTQHGPLFHRPADSGNAPTSPAEMRGLRVYLADADGAQRGDYAIEDVPRSAHLIDRAGRVWTEPLIGDGSLTVLNGDVEVALLRPEGAKWIESVYEDRQGNVWVLSSGGGLLQVTPEPFRRFGPDEGAPLFAESAFATTDGEILVSATQGAEDAPLFIVRDGAWTSGMVLPGAAAFPGDPNINPTVGMITEDGRGRRFGTYGSRLFRIRGDQVERVWQNTGGEYIQALFPDPADPDALWVGVGPGMLRHLDTEVLVFTDSLRVPLPTSGSAWSTDVHRTPDGQLWVASRGGLVVVEDGTPRAVEALAGVPVRDLETGPDGSLWAATETRGLVRIRDGEVAAIGLDEGLPTAYIMAVLFDDSGFVWLCGRSVLYRIRVADIERVLNASPADPIDVVTLPPSAGHLGSADDIDRTAKAPDGSLWIPSVRGVTRIDPAAYVRQFEVPPPVLVEAVWTESGERPLAAGRPSVRLPRGDRSLVMDYTAIDLTAPDLVRFRTQLVGLDDRWQDQGAGRSAAYGGLAPGTYTFRVRARSGGGVWGDPVEATLVVPAYFYETGWFVVLCTLGLLGILGLGLRARERTQRERRRRLEVLVDKRTEQLRAEKETVAAQAQSLETLDAAKSAFFANVSHEFRTPLMLTLGPLDDIKAGLYGPLTAPMAQQVDLARRNAGRVLDLINQILDVARLEAGRTPLHARLIDLGAFLEVVAQPFQALAERKAMTFEVNFPDTPVTVFADPPQFEKVIANLLSNALKFTPEGGTVRVSVRTEGGAARVTVRDSGPGISAVDLPHVFDRFYQVGSAAQTQLGTGIGLALAKEIMDLHGGTLTVESEEGFGSTFTVTLPLGRAHLAPDQIDETAEPWTPGATLPIAEPGGDGVPEAVGEDPAADVTTVLVVEDHPEVRAYIRRHLEAAPEGSPTYRVLEAADGEAGLALARERLPDIVLSDIMMPKLDGLGLCRALKADPETDFIPVILLTAKAAPEDKLEGLGEHADDYLTKPFDVAELRARIANLIAVRTRLRERFRQERMALVLGDDAAAPMRLPAPAAVTSADDAFLERVREAVEAHLSDETFSVERLAEAAGVSRGHLHRQLKALVGQTPTDLIRMMRLERAAHLLAGRAGTVSEIAYAVGFKSVGHFSDSFVQAYGCRPSVYASREGTAEDETV